MPVFSLTRDELRPLEPTSFAAAGLNERGDLQRQLREQIEAIAPGTLVIAEEFGDWEDSRRRIDLLGVDQDANLVVIELKRTEDGGHMELQAVRYAAMVSTMTFEQAVGVFSHYLSRRDGSRDAREALLDHLGWDEPDENSFAQDVRIVLAAADFSRELTTAVLWLNEHGLEVRCVRMKPYADGERLLVDIQQVIPLPEAEEYQVRIREKAQRERESRQGRTERQDAMLRFWQHLLAHAAERTPLHAGWTPKPKVYLSQFVPGGTGGLRLGYFVGLKEIRVELVVFQPRDRSQMIFDQLAASREAIETRFGEPLEWERAEGRNRSRVFHRMDSPGIEDEATWPRIVTILVSVMMRLDAALRPHLDRLRL